MATVLLVDDEQQICRMVACALAYEGFSVLTANSGSEALDIAHARPGGLDLLLSDLAMPGIDGASLAQELRVDSPGLPVIFMSGTWDPAVLQFSSPARFLPKPFSMTLLTQMARVMLSR